MENLYTRSYLSIVLFEQTNYSITLLLLPVRANNVQLRLGCVQLGRVGARAGCVGQIMGRIRAPP
jgi:hypothetical protein